jgi:hypothetical protein
LAPTSARHSPSFSRRSRSFVAVYHVTGFIVLPALVIVLIGVL